MMLISQILMIEMNKQNFNIQYKQTCEGHKGRGQCQNKPFYMLQNCKKTCEMCTPISKSTVRNRYLEPNLAYEYSI